MFCPQCRMEYREGFTRCADCGLALVAVLPPENRPEYVELVTVFESGHEGLIALARSILDGAGIPYFVKGETLQDLFAAGRIGIGYNPVIGPVEIQVNGAREHEARGLLKDLREGR